MDADDELQYRRKFATDFRNAIKSSSPDSDDRTALREGVKYYVYRLTMPEYRNDLPEKITELMRSINLFAAPQAREVLLAEITQIAPELFNQPKTPRLNAVLLLTRLDIESGDAVKNIPARPYVPASGPLMQVLNDENQLIEARIQASRGLGRILGYARDQDLDRRTRNNIISSLLQGLQQANDKHEWFRWRVVRDLGEARTPYNLNRQPVVLDALLRVAIDPTQPWKVRSQALESAAGLPLDAEVNVPLITYLVGNTALQLGREYNEKVAAGSNPKAWQEPFARIYLAFRPEKEDALRGRGLLTQAERTAALRAQQPVVEELYRLYLPLMNSVLNDRQIPADALESLEQWLGERVPDDWKSHPQGKPIPAQESPENAPTTAQTGAGGSN